MGKFRNSSTREKEGGGRFLNTYLITGVPFFHYLYKASASHMIQNNNYQPPHILAKLFSLMAYNFSRIIIAHFVK